MSRWDGYNFWGIVIWVFINCSCDFGEVISFFAFRFFYRKNGEDSIFYFVGRYCREFSGVFGGEVLDSRKFLRFFVSLLRDGGRWLVFFVRW